MDKREFEILAHFEWSAVPEKVASQVKNLALLIEDEPDEELRRLEGLGQGDTLLGIYRGIPLTARGSDYGVGSTLPDTITLFRLPILQEAQELTDDAASDFRKNVAKVIRETMWHEIGHYMGLDEEPIHAREREGTNRFEN